MKKKEIKYSALKEEIRSILDDSNYKSKYKSHICWKEYTEEERKGKGRDSYISINNLTVLLDEFEREGHLSQDNSYLRSPAIELYFDEIIFAYDSTKNININRAAQGKQWFISFRNLFNKSEKPHQIKIYFNKVEFNNLSVIERIYKANITIRLSEYDSAIFEGVTAPYINLGMEYSEDKNPFPFSPSPNIYSEKYKNYLPSCRASFSNSEFYTLSIKYFLPRGGYEISMDKQSGCIVILKNNTIGTFRHNVHFASREYKNNINEPQYTRSPKSILKITGDNNIKLLRFDGPYPYLQALGRSENIGIAVNEHPDVRDKLSEYGDNELHKKYREYIDAKLYENKSVLLNLKKAAIANHDRVQEVTLDKHVADCDEQIINADLAHIWSKDEVTMQEYFSWQDLVIMKIGKYLSNHGSSWTNPLVCIMFFSFLISYAIGVSPSISAFPLTVAISVLSIAFSFIIGIPVTIINLVSLIVGQSFCSSIEIDRNYPLILLDLLNPVSNLSNIFPLNDCFPWWWELIIVVIVVLAKFGYAICVYEFIRAARKFTIR